MDYTKTMCMGDTKKEMGKDALRKRKRIALDVMFLEGLDVAVSARGNGQTMMSSCRATAMYFERVPQYETIIGKLQQST